MLSLLAPVKDYCERPGPGLLAEPLNAASNVAFFIAAWLLLRLLKNNNSRDTALYLLSALIALIGFGSLSFHTFANRLTSMFDVAFIGIFLLAYLYVLLRRCYGLAPLQSVAGVSAEAAFVVVMQYAGNYLRLPVPGIYLAVLCSLVLLGMGLRRKRIGIHLFRASALFMLSLFFRTIDLPACRAFPVGTHFAWHLLNGALLYYLVNALMLASTVAKRRN